MGLETHCFINNNGNITFDRQLIDWTPNPLQNLGFTIIAPFWADVDTRPAKSDVVRYSYSSETVDGHPLPADAEVLVDPWPRPVLLHGRAVLLTEACGGGNESSGWRILSKEAIRRY